MTIAGSDSSGGAGIQADIKTMTMNGVFAMSAVTDLTAQNTTGVTDILEATPEFLAAELDAVFTDIRPDAVKVGMVSSAGLIELIAAKLREYGARHVVVDPVMVATSGAKLLRDDAIGTLKAALLPLAEVVTPNIPEAEILSGLEIKGAEDMEAAARKISAEYGCAVLCKGGHQMNDANDLLCRPDGETRWFLGRRIDNPNTHGTGCTLSSAIAANLAKGFCLEDSVERAKEMCIRDRYHTVFKKSGSKRTVNSVCTTFTGETSTSSEPAPGPSPPRSAARAGWRRGGSTWRSGCTGCSSPRSTWAPWLPRPALSLIHI